MRFPSAEPLLGDPFGGVSLGAGSFDFAVCTRSSSFFIFPFRFQNRSRNCEKEVREGRSATRRQEIATPCHFDPSNTITKIGTIPYNDRCLRPVIWHATSEEDWFIEHIGYSYATFPTYIRSVISDRPTICYIHLSEDKHVHYYVCKHNNPESTIISSS